MTKTTEQLVVGDTILTGKYSRARWMVVAITTGGNGFLVTLRNEITGAESESSATRSFSWIVVA